MTLNQLRYAVTAAESGSITEAAGKLFLSQPSLTSALHELEKELGITIFVPGEELQRPRRGMNSWATQDSSWSRRT